MFTRTYLRHAIAPTLLTGLLATTTFVAAPEASAAVIAPQSGAASGAAAALPDAVSAYRVVPGVRLETKPPPWVLPVTDYHLTGRFGETSGLWSTTHTGLDFAAPEGAELSSIGPGVVTEAAYDGSYGNKTVVRLDDGTVLWYCHQSALEVEVGQRVAPGDLIGYVGSTGNVTGPHLHLEVHPDGGDAVDPEAWLPEHDLQP